ncbi:peptidoglycan-binding protein [Clostridium sp. ZBS20]|uniref:peptidoglycan-binding protein n=1 Tax=Clostridium sp. ZBS20 TaxID=2949966 RepID=UPI00257DC5CE|nr:peptidoglycan-binding protein [Clostridium sp. ZBS20]
MFLNKGSRGENVKYLQYGLHIMCYSTNGIDGIYGGGTVDAVKRFQRTFGLNVDGIVGDGTWGKLCEEIRKVQQALRNKGYSISVDGVAGPSTFEAVKSFQRSNGLSADGMVGQGTWSKLRGESSNNNNGGESNPGTTSSSLGKFVDCARGQVGYEESGTNITKYGQWYGMNGQPWCAMFVSWCANQAGILNSVVPRYASCNEGANWYKNRGRYKTRGTGYVPKTGDVIFFNSNGINHTGIVESASSGTVYTIEGNSSDAVKKRSYNLTNSYINGYGVN